MLEHLPCNEELLYLSSQLTSTQRHSHVNGIDKGRLLAGYYVYWCKWSDSFRADDFTGYQVDNDISETR